MRDTFRALDVEGNGRISADALKDAMIQHNIPTQHVEQVQHTATHCNTLQQNERCYDSLRHSHPSLYCNALQHAATRGNTWQHMATH